MNAVATLNDARGVPVAAGDRVRILAVSPDPDMDEDDRDMIEFMIGSVCEVDRIDAAGQAWVTMWWSCADGVATSSVALEGEQIERVAG
ncbi:MAG TPA: hypothetical protein VI279_01310 [Rhodocyclaceae bacterium]